MRTSVNWLNRCLDPAGKGPLTPDEAEHVLTDVGFPIETREPLATGDTMLDVEVTSNRGDCLSHVGLAREIAARTGRRLLAPAPFSPPTGPEVGGVLRLDNQTPDACPLFTARVIRGVKIGPSPRWLRELLEAVGQRSINNVVDVTNWVNLELGQPTHVFDLARLAGSSLVVRWARDGEALTTLDGKKRTLRRDELVVADAERAQSLAGVIGGQDSEVHAGTTDVVLEAATWDPVVVRRASRRHQVRTDASHRFERLVDARTVDAAARRAAGLIVELAGGTLGAGVLTQGRPLGAPVTIDLRPARCSAVLGVDVAGPEIVRVLSALEVRVDASDAARLRCEPPPFRPDLEREIDLIEEVARLRGLDQIPIAPTVAFAPRGPQDSERALRELGTALTGMGYSEAVTFSFVTPKEAAMFMPPGLRPLTVDEARRPETPALRPSVLTGLLGCRRQNRGAGESALSASGVAAGVRLYEWASVFAQDAQGRTVEHRNVALLMDVPGSGRKRSFSDRQQGFREVVGAVEALARVLGGPGVALSVRAMPPAHAGFDPGASAGVLLRGEPVGSVALASDAALRHYELEVPVAMAELNLDALLGLFPARAVVSALDEFPGIERDVSFILGESVPWARVSDLIGSARLEHCVGHGLVTTYRGEQVGAGKKSVTARLRFRRPDRTMRREEVDPQMSALVDLARRELGAEVRAV